MRTKVLFAVLFFAMAMGSVSHSQVGESPTITPESSTQPSRPTSPPQTPPSNAPVTINFVDMELSEVITNISRITGKNFIWDEKVKGKVTIISPTGIPVEEAFRVFEAVLRFNGYQLVPVPGVKNLYKIMRIQDVPGQPIPTYLQGQWSPPTEAYVTRLIRLKYLDVNEAANVLNNLKSPEGKILPYPPTNSMIIIESANNLNRLVRILEQMDIPTPRPVVKIVRLKYAPADQLANELNQIFSAGAINVSAQAGEQPPQPAGRPQEGGRVSPRQTPGTAPLKLIPDTRTNSLIIIAEAELIEDVLRLIEELDISVEGEEGIYVYYCRNANASDLAATLSSLTSGTTTRRTSTQPVPGQPRPPTPTPTPEGAAPQPATPPSSSSGVINLGSFGGEVRITADEATNSLVIIASRQDYATLLQVIKKLDIRRRQVFVEAVILEIELSDSSSVGTSFAVAQAIDHDAAAFASTALGGLNAISLYPAIAALGTLTSGSTNFLPGGFSVGALAKTVTINVAGTPVEIPTFSALFNALIASNNVNVLSTPNLLTTDNEEAEIVVGQNVPIPTGSTTSSGGVTTTTIQRQNVGIKLKVTPQISESNTIRLILFTEISGVVQTAVAGIDVNQLGITTSIKSAQTTVIVDNNQTVVIGGLIEERETEAVYKVPLLGDIPVLGWLFKTRTREKKKTNLVILLTPHIVRDAADLTNLTNEVNKRRQRFLNEATGGRYREPFYMEPLLLPESPQDNEEGVGTPTNPPAQPTSPPVSAPIEQPTEPSEGGSIPIPPEDGN